MVSMPARKIPLKIRRWFGENGLFLTFALRGVPHIRMVPIDGLVDTGSPWLTISPKDRELLNIPLSKLIHPSENINIRFGGYRFRRFILKDVEIHLLDENEKLFKVHMPSVSVLTAATKQDSEVYTLPSVVGMDFLSRIGQFVFHCDFVRKGCYLLKNQHPAF